MKIRLHKNATITLVVRQVIKESPLSAYAIAKKYNISQITALRWKISIEHGLTVLSLSMRQINPKSQILNSK